MTQPGDHSDPAAKTQAELDAAKKQQQHAPTDQAGLGGGTDDSVHDSATAALQDGHILFNPPPNNFSAAATETRLRAELGNGVPFTQTATLQVGDQRLTGALSGNRLVTPDGQYQVQPNGQGSYDVRPMDAQGRVDPSSTAVQGRVTFERPLDQPMSQPQPQPNQRFDATPTSTAGDVNRIAAPPANPHPNVEQTAPPVKPQTVAEAPAKPDLSNDNSARPGGIANPTQNPNAPRIDAPAPAQNPHQPPPVAPINEVGPTPPSAPPQPVERAPVTQQFNPPPERPVVQPPVERVQAQPPVERLQPPPPVDKSVQPQGDRPNVGPQNDIRVVKIEATNPVGPGTELKVVNVNPHGPDARVQQIAVEMNIKGGGQPPIEGLRLPDGRVIDPTARVQPHGLDGTPGPTGKGGDQPVKGGLPEGVIPHGIIDGAKLPGQGGGIPGLNLIDAQNRQFITVVIGQLQTDRLGTFDPRSQNLTDILKGLDPSRVGALQNFFTHMTAEGGRPGVLTGEMMIARLTGLLNAQDTAMRANADLSAMLRGGAMRETAGGAYLTELTRTLDAINRHSGMDGAITLSNLVGRQLGDQNSGNLVARLLPGQENVVRNMLDTKEGTAVRLAGKEQVQTERAIDKAEGRGGGGKGEKVPDKGETAGRPDAAEIHATRVTDAAAAAAGIKKEDAQELQPNTVGTEETVKDKHKEEKVKKEEETDPQTEQEAARRAALAALLASRKLKDDSEKEEKEKEQAQEKDKKNEEENKRRRYIVKEKDTLQTIASRQLRDVRLAPLVLQINRAVIPVTMQRGREVVNLKVGTSIWLPSMTEIKEFRGRLASATGSVPPAASTEKKFASVEEELASKYGLNWAGMGKKPGADNRGPAQTPATIGGAREVAPPVPLSAAESEMMADAVAVSQTRRENIERLLGPIRKPQEVSDRIRYVIRLGDNLKSVAMKHPAVSDITLWKLIARLNDMTEDTDERGMPLAKLSRGTILSLPTAAEIEAFRAEQRGETQPPRDSELLTLDCQACGSKNPTFATTCSACSGQLRVSAEPEPADEEDSGPDAATILLQAAGFVTRTKPEDPEES
jgi:hypothetical protein